MKYNILFNNPYDINITTYLNKCGISDAKKYIQGGYNNIESPELYDNMQKAFEMILRDHTMVYLVQDCDPDGVTSCALAYMFLEHICKPNVRVLFHDKKTHGLSDDIMEQITDDGGLIWLPDAGSNDIEQCKILKDKDYDILITDHHKINVANPYAVIINNQSSSKVTNKSLAGVGVTFKFIQYHCMKTDDDFYKYYIDLVALGNISDVMDMRTLENRAFAKWGLKHLRNPLFKLLCKDRIDNLIDISPKDIQWRVTPLINSVCRSDNQDLKLLMFKGFVGDVSDFREVVDKLIDQHQKQSNEVSKLFVRLSNEVQEGHNTVLMKYDDTPYTGLIANKLRDYYAKDVLLVHKEDDEYIGSCRAYGDKLTQLKNSGIMTMCAGHPQAFGVGWKCNDTDSLIKYMDETPVIEQRTDVSCNCIDGIPTTLFYMCEQYKPLWGQGIPSPTIYISLSSKDIDINLIGKGKRTLKFTWNGVEFIKFRISNKDKEMKGNIDIIGEPTLNRWGGREKKQIIITDWKER